MARHNVKRHLFARHAVVMGFTDAGVVLFNPPIARCQFPGCETWLTYAEATLDRYPVPGRHGGTYHIDNVRLACEPCNTADGKPHAGEPSIMDGLTKRQRRVFRKAMRRGTKPVITREEILGPNWREGYIWEHHSSRWSHDDHSGTPVMP